MTQPLAARRLGYRPELDGVRACAVLGILGYHLAFMVPWLHNVFQGGFISVDIFFVLSGMLITEILLSDFDRRGSVSLRSFYNRRGRRLLPALTVFVVATIVYYQLVHHDGRHVIKGFLTVITYVTYGHQVVAFPPGVSQVWTLVVEWEFYFVWPVLLVLMLRRRLSLDAIAAVTVILLLAVSMLRALMYHHTGNFNLSYFSAWYRFQDLLAGCIIGLVGARPQASNLLRTAGVVFLAVVTSRAIVDQSWLYYYGYLIAAVSTAIICQARAKPWWFDRFLASRFIVWCGKISYSLYLWSVFAVSEVGHEASSWPRVLQVITATALAFGLASASYYLIEDRFRVTSRRAPADGHRPVSIPGG